MTTIMKTFTEKRVQTDFKIKNLQCEATKLLDLEYSLDFIKSMDSILAVKSEKDFLVVQSKGTVCLIRGLEVVWSESNRSKSKLKSLKFLLDDYLDAVWSEPLQKYFIYEADSGIFELDYERKELVFFSKLNSIRKPGKSLRLCLSQKYLACNHEWSSLALIDCEDPKKVQIIEKPLGGYVWDHIGFGSQQDTLALLTSDCWLMALKLDFARENESDLESTDHKNEGIRENSVEELKKAGRLLGLRKKDESEGNFIKSTQLAAFLIPFSDKHRQERATALSVCPCGSYFLIALETAKTYKKPPILSRIVILKLTDSTANKTEIEPQQKFCLIKTVENFQIEYLPAQAIKFSSNFVNFLVCGIILRPRESSRKGDRPGRSNLALSLFIDSEKLHFVKKANLGKNEQRIWDQGDPSESAWYQEHRLEFGRGAKILNARGLGRKLFMVDLFGSLYSLQYYA